MKLIIAGASSTPEPSALASATPPSRTASTRPATPSCELRVEFERIGEIAVDAPPDHVGALEAGDGAHMDLAVAHGEVAAFDQNEAEIAGEIGLFEIGFAEGPGVHRQMRGSERSASAVRPARKAWKKGARRSTFMSR